MTVGTETLWTLLDGAPALRRADLAPFARLAGEPLDAVARCSLLLDGPEEEGRYDPAAVWSWAADGLPPSAWWAEERRAACARAGVPPSGVLLEALAETTVEDLVDPVRRHARLQAFLRRFLALRSGEAARCRRLAEQPPASATAVRVATWRTCAEDAERDAALAVALEHAAAPRRAQEAREDVLRRLEAAVPPRFHGLALDLIEAREEVMA